MAIGLRLLHIIRCGCGGLSCCNHGFKIGYCRSAWLLAIGLRLLNIIRCGGGGLSCCNHGLKIGGYRSTRFLANALRLLSIIRCGLASKLCLSGCIHTCSCISACRGISACGGICLDNFLFLIGLFGGIEVLKFIKSLHDLLLSLKVRDHAWVIS